MLARRGSGGRECGRCAVASRSRRTTGNLPCRLACGDESGDRGRDQRERAEDSSQEGGALSGFCRIPDASGPAWLFSGTEPGPRPEVMAGLTLPDSERCCHAGCGHRARRSLARPGRRDTRANEQAGQNQHAKQGRNQTAALRGHGRLAGYGASLRSSKPPVYRPERPAGMALRPLLLRHPAFDGLTEDKSHRFPGQSPRNHLARPRRSLASRSCARDLRATTPLGRVRFLDRDREDHLVKDSPKAWANTTHDWATVADHEHLAQIREHPATVRAGWGEAPHPRGARLRLRRGAVRG